MNKLLRLGTVCTAMLFCLNAVIAASFTPLGFLEGNDIPSYAVDVTDDVSSVTRDQMAVFLVRTFGYE